MQSTIKVMIVDDHSIFREGVKQIVSDTRDIAVVSEAESGRTAIQLCRQHDCDVLLLDISLPDRSGLEVLKQVKKESPKVAVLMLSMHREDLYAVRSIKSGAAGYLNKQSAPGELVNAIRLVSGGKRYISPVLAQELASHVSEERPAMPHEALSDREYQTLTMIASGKTVTGIADELALSVKTVSMYRTRLLSKMKLKHNAELTHYAIKNQLVD